MTNTIFLGVLGPLEVRCGDHPVRVGGVRQQTVLALLGMEPNRVVTIDRLIDGVWGDAPPPTARSQIQIAVSMLRRALPGDGRNLVRTAGPGYVLEAGEQTLDLLRFEALAGPARALAGRGDTAGAAAALHAALALWRGPALTGLDGRVVREGADRLDERRLAVIEDRVRLDLELGRHAGLIGELRELTDRHPLRERFHGQLMTALFRSGRQAEALHCYRTVRDRMIEELGLEPGAELRAVERQILCGGRDDAAPAVLPRQLPADIADFTGRAALVDRAVRVLATPSDGVPVVALSGAYGVGKTVTAVRVARRAGDAFPDGQLFATVGDTDPAEIRARFLHALGIGESTPGIDGSTPRTGDTAPGGRVSTAAYRSHLAGRRILLVLDDVRDDAHLAGLLPATPGSAVITTSRAWLPLPAAHHFELGPLAGDDAVELLTRTAGADRVRHEPGSALDLVELCGGNPLALRIAGSRLAARRHWTVARLVAGLRAATCLDELQHAGLSVRERIADGYRRVPVSSRRLLRRLALIDLPVVTVALCAALLDAAPDTAERAAEALVEQRLLSADRGGDGLVRYGIPRLTRAFAAERLPAEESAQQRTAARRRGTGALLDLLGAHQPSSLTAARPASGKAGR